MVWLGHRVQEQTFFSLGNFCLSVVRYYKCWVAGISKITCSVTERHSPRKTQKVLGLADIGSDQNQGSIVLAAI